MRPTADHPPVLLKPQNSCMLRSVRVNLRGSYTDCQIGFAKNDETLFKELSIFNKRASIRNQVLAASTIAAFFDIFVFVRANGPTVVGIPKELLVLEASWRFDVTNVSSESECVPSR